MQSPQALYLDLIKQCLTYRLWGGERIRPIRFAGSRTPPAQFLARTLKWVLDHNDLQLGKKIPYDDLARIEGRDWPLLAETMIGIKRLDNLQFCVEDVLKNDVAGDLIETGVWRGGAAIFMRAILKAYGITDRNVWVADSFQGLPVPDPEKYAADANDNLHQATFLQVPLEEVMANFEKYDLLDDQVRFLKGWFKETLPTAPIRTLAVLRVDGDMYESTMDALTSLYPKLSVNGYVIIDDYTLKGCHQAVHDFREKHLISDQIRDIDGSGVYWQRT
jgi:Macrocin-O-methyltransferase (TylF)